MAKRFIDADALLEELQEELDFESLLYTKEQNEWFNKGLKCAIRDVKHQPTADVAEVRQGKWVHTDYAMHWLGKDECSECTYHTSDRDDLSHLKYCPNCGARMDGDEDD